MSGAGAFSLKFSHLVCQATLAVSSVLTVLAIILLERCNAIYFLIHKA